LAFALANRFFIFAHSFFRKNIYMQIRYSFFAFILILGLGCSGTRDLASSNNAIPQEQPPLAMEGFASPESIFPLDGGTLLVSNLGAEPNPTVKDGDGFISKISRQGEMIERYFIQELHAPKGMASNQINLFVADIDEVKVFDLGGGAFVSSFDFSSFGTAYLNDLLLIGEDRLIVSASDVNMLFEINLNTEEIKSLPLPSDFYGPNGLTFDEQNRQLYVVGFGKEYSVKGKMARYQTNDLMEFDSFELLDMGEGRYDGAHWVAEKGELLFSDWAEGTDDGNLRYYNPETGYQTPLRLERGIAGPADFYFDEESRKIWIPAMLEGIIYRFDMTNK
jgi:hypothetical protein